MRGSQKRLPPSQLILVHPARKNWLGQIVTGVSGLEIIGCFTILPTRSESSESFEFAIAAKFITKMRYELMRKYAAEQQISEDEALAKGMEQKSVEFNTTGAELYAKA